MQKHCPCIIFLFIISNKLWSSSPVKWDHLSGSINIFISHHELWRYLLILVEIDHSKSLKEFIIMLASVYKIILLTITLWHETKWTSTMFTLIAVQDCSSMVAVPDQSDDHTNNNRIRFLNFTNSLLSLLYIYIYIYVFALRMQFGIFISKEWSILVKEHM